MNGMTLLQFQKLVKEVDSKHLLVRGRCIKYINFVMDFRFHTIFAVKMRPFGREVHFTTTNRNIPGQPPPKHDNLFDEIMEWLSEGEDVARPNESSSAR